MRHPILLPARDASPLRIALWLWAGCGLAALLLFPELRERSAAIGWLPFWLVVAPLVDLLLLDRVRLMALPRALLVRARQRRRPARQARRHIRHRRARLRPLLAALLSR